MSRRLATGLLVAAILVGRAGIPLGAVAQSAPAARTMEQSDSTTGAATANPPANDATTASATTSSLSLPEALPPPVDPLAGLTITSSPDRPADLVVLVSIDGLRADALLPSHPTFSLLRRTGVTADHDWTIRRSTTLASHASMLTGVDADVHGLTWNGWRPERGRIRFPTVLRVASRAGLAAAMFVGKNKLRHLLGEEDTGVTFSVNGRSCTNVVAHAAPWLRSTPAGIAVLHFAGPDSAGHRRRWMSPAYRAAVAEADGCVGDVIRVLGERTGGLARVLLIVTSDHGGHGRSHGTSLATDRHIPWFAWGGAAANAHHVERALTTMDTAATLLAALGLPQTAGIVGRPITEALRPRQAVPAHANSAEARARRRSARSAATRAPARASH